jgi:hypothetical protein
MNRAIQATSTATLRPILTRKHVLAIWVALIVASLVYCELSEVVHGAPPVDWRVSLGWSLEVWGGWILLTVVAPRFGHLWPAWAGGGVRHLPLVLISILALSLFTLAWEWTINLVLAAYGWSEQWHSIWVLAYQRTPFCLIGSAALITWTRLGSRISLGSYPHRVSETPVNAPSARTSTNSVIVIPGRTGPVTIKLANIEALIAAENYVTVCTDDGREYLYRATLVGAAAGLRSMTLVRVHRSAFVNVVHVRQRLRGFRLKLASGRTVRVGRAFRDSAACIPIEPRHQAP